MSQDYVDVFHIPEVSAFTEEEKREADKLQTEIDNALKTIQLATNTAARSWLRLGAAVHRVQEKLYWMLWGFASFGQYVDSIKNKVEKGRTQIYNAVSVVKQLGPYVDQSSLDQMGISKASLLASYIRRTSLKPPENLIEQAKDSKVTIAELKAAIFEAEHQKDMPPHTTYFDLGGIYVTSDEKAEILRAFEVAAKVDPPISNECPEVRQRTEIILRLAREFLATYEAAVKRGQA